MTTETTTSTITLTNVCGTIDEARQAATKLAKIVSGSYLNLRNVGACPVGGSANINVTGDGTEEEVKDMALWLLAEAAIA